MSDLNLLEKTELWINGITLDNADLTEMAAALARVVGLPDNKVAVVDVRPAHITFDLLVKEIPAENVTGKEQEILSALSAVPGVSLSPDCYIHSNGILGIICAQNTEILDKVEKMRNEIESKISRRAIVFPTGFELQGKLIKDTNTPYIKSLLENSGYKVTTGEPIPDNVYGMTEALSDALNRGFGLIITTGGVGAEDKDCSVESVLALDPDAAAPYIVKFKQGQGRHFKDGIRICVGTVGISTLITLPGPHDEVELTAPLLIDLLSRKASKHEIATTLAGVLSEKWRHGHSGGGHHHHSHNNG